MEYWVECNFSGVWDFIIEAENEEEAQIKAEEGLDNRIFKNLKDADEVYIDHFKIKKKQNSK